MDDHYTAIHEIKLFSTYSSPCFGYKSIDLKPDKTLTVPHQQGRNQIDEISGSLRSQAVIISYVNSASWEHRAGA